MISLFHLRYFHDAALLQGVGAAAKKNRVSPSAISQAIRGLEAHYQVELLRHSKNRFELTEAGRSLLERSYGMFREAERLDEEMAWAKEANAGVVNFATQQSIAHHILPPFLAHLRQKYPAIRPQMRFATTDIVKELLQRREVDFILSVDNVAYDAFKTKPILEGHYVLAGVSAAVKAPNTSGFLVPSSTKEAQTFRHEYEALHGTPPPIVMDIDSWGVIKRLAEEGLGVGLFPDYLLRFEPKTKLQVLDVGLQPMTYGVSAYYCSKRNILSKVSRIFLDELEAFSHPKVTHA